VALEVVPRFLALWLIACSVLRVQAADAARDPQGIEESRESRRAEVDAGFRHVGTIHRPEREIAASKIGQPYLTAASPKILVVGSISDAQIASMLAHIHQQYGDRAKRVTRVTGDDKYAVVELGDRKLDVCCFATFLFANRNANWVMLTAVSMSH
jgi:hypothetical protein